MTSAGARRIQLGEALKGYRSAQDWKVDEAAAATGIAPMTWRGLEAGLSRRPNSYGAIDSLLDLRRGTTARALDEDDTALEIVLKALDYDPAPQQEADRELVVMQTVAEAVESLPVTARGRVVRYLLDRYDADRSAALGRQIELARTFAEED